MTRGIETLFMTHRIELFFWLIDLNLFLSMIQRIESLFEYDSKNRIFFEAKKTHRIEPFFSPAETNPSFQYDAKNWTFLVFQHDSKNWIFFWLTQKKLNRISRIWLKELRANFVKNDSKNWIFFQYVSMNWTFFLNMTHRIEPFFNMIERILNFSKIMTHWIEPFLQKKMAQRMFWKVKKWLQELIFLNITHRIEPFFFWHDLQNWTHFFNMTHRIFFYKNVDSQKWLILSGKMTQRIEPFFFFWIWLKESNSFFNVTLFSKKKKKNWTLFQKKWLKELNLLWM